MKKKISYSRNRITVCLLVVIILTNNDNVYPQTESKSLTNNNRQQSVKLMETRAQLLENSVLAIWSEPNADKRLEEMKKTYAVDVHFYEFNSEKAVIGYKAINELIAKLQKEWPPETRFELNKPSQVNHQIQVVSWNMGPQGKPPVATGIDVAVIENDLIKSFYLFIDTPLKSN
jgi:arginyl-tRNA synthetase